MLFDFVYPNCWDALKASELPVVLYGMGNGADKTLDEFEKHRIKAAGVMASDGFVRHQEFRGFTVKSEKELTKELGSFTVALCFASSLPDVMAYIENVSKRHEMIIPNVPVVGTDILDDHFLSENREDIEKAYALLADEASKKVFKGALHFFYTGRLHYLKEIESSKEEAYADILKLKDERYLDLGAYRGDTVEEFLRFSDGYEHITAVEPNPKNFAKLQTYAGSIPNTALLNAGISESPGVMYISKKSGRMAALNDQNGAEVAVTSVDEIDRSPTYIKTDIEGFEERMLNGAKETLKTKPKLNLAAYHRTGDFFRLILQINRLNPDYMIYLRKHPYIPCWDLNIYAV
ncbi:MAG: FkbM family methyltransferase [Ruminococcus sp.]|nr:FkbM family methyltransferase [Ruminococcus sp.]